MTQKMRLGVCPGCGEEGRLPPFADGMCFLCATDGPPNEHTPKGGTCGQEKWDRLAAELQVVEAERDRFKLLVFVLNEFALAQGLARANGGHRRRVREIDG